VTRLQAIDFLLGRAGQRVEGFAHIHELRVAAGVRQFHSVESGRLRRRAIVRVIGVIALAGNVGLAVLELVLVGDVVDGGTIRHREARIVLRKYLTEQFHRLQKLRRAERLVANAKNGVIDEGLVQSRAGGVVDGLSQIDAADLGACVCRQRLDRKRK